jgi:hypothetical protein
LGSIVAAETTDGELFLRISTDEVCIDVIISSLVGRIILAMGTFAGETYFQNIQ